MGTALQVTGGAEWLAGNIVSAVTGHNPLFLLGGVFLLTTAFSQVISNTATTVLVAPIVMAAAGELGISPYPLLMAVAVSASTAFLTPIGTTTNVLVMVPGGYSFADYFKLGAPITVMFLIMTLLIVPLIWPF